MPKFYSLFSSSKGNWAYLENVSGGILIDASPSFKSIENAFSLREISLENLKGVIITHEHSDHIGGLKTLTKKLGVPIYASKKVLNYLNDKDFLHPDSKTIEIDENGSFEVSGFEISPFRTPHDALESFGFIINYKNSKFGFATDLGYLPRQAFELIRGSALVYIESNHDKKMLMNCQYPYIIKKRIAGDSGHLSNEQASQIVVDLARFGTKYFVLSHISENSNTLEQAYVTNARALEDAGYQLEKDIFIRYSRQVRPGNYFYFGEENV